MSEKLRWGIICTAGIAVDRLIPAMQASSNGEVVAIGSRKLEKAQDAAHKLGIHKAYGSYQEVLDDAEVDAVYNPLPVSMHAEWSIKAMEAGKPVLCEKPLTVRREEALLMEQAAQENDVRLAEALMYRYHPLTRKVLEMIRDGAIGELRVLESEFNVDIKDGDIRLRRETGGGAVLDLGVYCISILRHMAGEEPDAIHAVGSLNDEQVDISTSAALHFPSGVVGHMACCLRSAFNCCYSATGTGGRILVDHGAMVAWPGEAFKIKYWHGDEYEEIETPEADPYQLLVEDFADAVLNNRQPRFAFEDTLANLEVSDKILTDVGYF
ncbi:MAG: Gfo/Idh/MocA family protein [Candidatus Sumerlaeota bacterium]